MGAHSLLTREKSAIVFFDTDCLLCNRTVQLLLKADSKKLLKFAGLGSELGIEFKNQFSISIDSVLLYYKGRYYFKSKAFFKISGILGFPYNVLQVFRVIPGRISDKVYDWIAKNRFKWFGKTDHCLIPEKKYSGRIIL
ncbi:MAG: DUF393 domain-containing protein [Cyclobacteriaceae bacterium]|nr:DUF393 domain-containing protein [Cyclobacteriaceae bacterium]